MDFECLTLARNNGGRDELRNRRFDHVDARRLRGGGWGLDGNDRNGRGPQVRDLQRRSTRWGWEHLDFRELNRRYRNRSRLRLGRRGRRLRRPAEGDGEITQVELL